MKKELSILIVGLVCILTVFGLGFLGGYQLKKANLPEPRSDTLRFDSYDTAWFEKATPKHDTVIDSIPYPVPVWKWKTQWEHDTVHDTVFVYLPMQQRFYHYPDTMDLWISGYEPKLDSMTLYFKHHTEIINTIQERQVPKMPLLCLNVGCGAFLYEKQPKYYLFGKVSLYPKKWDISIGAAVSHDLKPIYGLTASRRFEIIK